MEVLWVDVRSIGAVEGFGTDAPAVVLAPGAQVRRPAVPGICGENVLTFEEVLRSGPKACEHHDASAGGPGETGERVLIWGDHFGAARFGLTLPPPSRLFARVETNCSTNSSAASSRLITSCWEPVELAPGPMKS